MNKISKELIKIAKQLQSVPTDTVDNFEKYQEDYYNKYGEYPNKELWDLFQTQQQVQKFLQNKSRQFPHLKQIISKDTIKRLLEKDWFVIVSAGKNNKEIENGNVTNEQIKDRYYELKNFLEGLDVPYYQVIGQYGGNSELSYIVDLSDNGMNNQSKVKQLLRRIRSFCGEKLKQDAIIQGIGRQRVWMYTNSPQLSHIKKIKESDPAKSEGRSQVFTDKYDKTNNETWSDDYDFDNPQRGDWITN